MSVPLIKEKVFAGLEFQYTSRRRTVYTTPIGDTVAGGDAAGFGVVNFTLFSRNLVKNLEFSASVYNVLDHKYGDPATRFHRGRSSLPPESADDGLACDLQHDGA